MSGFEQIGKDIESHHEMYETHSHASVAFENQAHCQSIYLYVSDWHENEEPEEAETATAFLTADQARQLGWWLFQAAAKEELAGD